MTGPIDLGSAPPETALDPAPAGGRHAPRRTPSTLPPRRAVTRWPTWCEPFPNGPRRGRRWVRWLATTSRPTPVSGSAITAASTPCAGPDGRGAGSCGGRTRATAGFLRCVDGLRAAAAAIGETAEEERCALFLRQLDPAWPPAGLAGPGRPVTGRGRGPARAPRWCLASCGSPFPGRTLGQQVHSWATTTGLVASLSTLRGDARRIAAVEARHDAGRGAHRLRRARERRAGRQPEPAQPRRHAHPRSSPAAYASASAAGRHCLTGAGGDRALLPARRPSSPTAQSGYVKAEARLDALDATGPGPSS